MAERSVEALNVLRELDSELAAVSERAGRSLVWTAGDRAVLELIADTIDRKVDLSVLYDATPDITPRVKLSAEIRLLEGSLARLVKMVHTDVLRAIRVVHSGKRLIPPEVAERLTEYFPQIVLTEREVQVLSFVARGMANKDIAHRLGTASGTIKMHVQNILSKLGAADRTHAVTIALERGILHLNW